ncbi:MAG: PhoH family protein [Porticoccaceae bacterium]
MNTAPAVHSIMLEPHDTRRLASLCGQFDENLHQIEQRLGIEIRNRGNVFAFYGETSRTYPASNLLRQLYSETDELSDLSPERVHVFLQQSDMELRAKSSNAGALHSDKEHSSAPPSSPQHYQQHSQQQAPGHLPVNGTSPIHDSPSGNSMDTTASSAHPSGDNSPSEPAGDNIASFTVIRTKNSKVLPRGLNQQHYVRAIQTHDINFGIGPAGTGKTYLAVACAVEAFMRNDVERILLVRPAVEAGEKLGFLPGDLAQKVDPYLRPLYDALYEMLGTETVGKLIERQVIEVAPLAYMRGRTLNNAYIILDESQNTTREQMKMFLTRIGFGATAVITGDLTQIDLPRGTHSGLLHASEVLSNIDGISFTRFLSKDVVRHPLVQRIVEAYDSHENDAANTNANQQR